MHVFVVLYCTQTVFFGDAEWKTFGGGNKYIYHFIKNQRKRIKAVWRHRMFAIVER